MKKDIACSSACTKAEPVEVSSSAAKRLMDRIKEDYHAHLLVDNLPSATKYEVPKTGEVFYDLGYKIGWVGEDGKVFLNNHLDIVMLYHEHMPGLYRVVGFEVKPRSIKSVSFTKDKECTGVEKETNFYELKEEGQRIYWTYSVTWQISDIPWASRWDVYLSVKAVDIHWFSILNSIVVVLSLSGFLSVSIVRTVRRDIAHYNKDEAEDDTLEETGWKLVHGDVFRPPPHQMILVNMVGTGIQLLGMTGTLFPSLILGSGFLLNFFLIGKQSSGAVPFGTMIALLLMWFGIDLPLVFLGFYFGYRKQVPDQPWYLRTIPCTLLAGVLPFGAMFIELFFIFSAIWENQFYYLFGFLFIVCMILVISTAQISVVATYFMLCAENYRWWWKSFIVSGGSAVYVMAYSIFYYNTKLDIEGFVPTVLYFSYSALMAITFWFLTGTIGFYASYAFLRRIYAAVKID
ncbi:endomembrane protein 70 [Teladorsagia circumcincta]|uniref:Transmembrane 9 superfamily member n=1 Tax=Teladorsagia circumcincta TaxID=45464 RepID=A0A2G9V0J6_TELCI|nr:endomembrane protein 70 [Teladorsagia circumcincta]